MNLIDSIKSYFTKSLVPQQSESQMGAVQLFTSEQAWDNWITKWQTGIDFQAELGDLRLSVLLMAAARWAGINLSIGKLTVVEIGADQSEKILDRHPFLDLFNSPNPDTTPKMLWKQFAASWVFAGESYFLLGRDNAGRVKEIYYEPNDTIRPRWDVNKFPEDETSSAMVRYFEINRGGQWSPWMKKDVLAIYDLFDPITRRGMNGVQSLLQTLFTDQERETYTALLMKNFGVTPKAVAPKNPGQSVKAAEIKENLSRAWSGKDRGKPNVFNEPMEVLDFGTDFSADAMTKIAHLSESRVAAAVGISVQSLQFLVAQLSSTYNNLETFLRRDYQQWIIPTHGDFIDACTKRIFRDLDANPNHQLRFDYSQVPVMQPDKRLEAERIRGLYKDRIINQAEAREAVEYDFTPDQQGVWYPVQATTITLSPLQEEPKPPTPADPNQQPDQQVM